jgi:hypothetical protein
MMSDLIAELLPVVPIPTEPFAVTEPFKIAIKVHELDGEVPRAAANRFATIAREPPIEANVVFESDQQPIPDLPY